MHFILVACFVSFSDNSHGLTFSAMEVYLSFYQAIWSENPNQVVELLSLLSLIFPKNGTVVSKTFETRRWETFIINIIDENQKTKRPQHCTQVCS